jgi:hypothetical protein
VKGVAIGWVAERGGSFDTRGTISMPCRSSYHKVLPITFIAALCIACVATAEVALSPSETQPRSAAEEHLLDIIDEQGARHTIDRRLFLRLPRHEVEVKDHDLDVKFQGASLVDLLESIGVKFGSELRGKRTPTVAIFEAADGYRVVVSLLDFDPATTDRLALVADQRDNQPLDAHLGPYRLVIPGDKRAVRWIRNIRTIRVINLIDLPLIESPNEDAPSQ